MLSQPKTKGAFDSFTPNGIIILKREKPKHSYQKEDNPQNSLQKEATVLGFAITGFLSIISGKKSTKPFAMSSLTSSAVSFLAAGAGLFLLADGLASLEIASRRCDSEREYLSTLPYSMYYYSIYEFKDCLLASVSLTGVLVVMLVFTVLELLLAAYASILWWKQVYSNNPGSEFPCQGYIQHVKKLFKVISNTSKSSSRSWIEVTPQKKKEKCSAPGKV
ncbi:membrane-spanning 4-domains subfamily A member 7 isoform X2 [Callorhinus ursinus]|uniref:Membrane-spanning 4-domains subfamily A member 7 isoform X2 n=1 Tax=Callorhinus ursinus TaxID=34884 RepID=A0A3Q7PLM8_CALUR|nr:membrane-spanning 4-domains subfamily A member 7 isoform X2 [Callorhinus ursinus]XP_025734624.1 membrane-spanning 4-domains subfamily A member 7 isoform X2 [Callorhinus ursinus]